MNTEPNQSGLLAARRYSHWNIGDRLWADQIINAYLNPDETHRLLDEEQAS